MTVLKSCWGQGCHSQRGRPGREPGYINDAAVSQNYSGAECVGQTHWSGSTRWSALHTTRWSALHTTRWSGFARRSALCVGQLYALVGSMLWSARHIGRLYALNGSTRWSALYHPCVCAHRTITRTSVDSSSGQAGPGSCARQVWQSGKADARQVGGNHEAGGWPRPARQLRARKQNDANRDACTA
eukprot:353477-Chlamydomonas_euryale.AAC.4